jgi:hypothetical protein
MEETVNDEHQESSSRTFLNETPSRKVPVSQCFCFVLKFQGYILCTLKDHAFRKVSFVFVLSRDELLSIVRKHSSFLKTRLVSGGANNGEENELDTRFWRELVDMFFVRGMSDLKGTQDDDLVFFVRNEVSYQFILSSSCL